MTQTDLKEAEQRMQKVLDALKSTLSKLRTGRAHPDLVAHLTVSYYGVDTPLSQVANITVTDARTLTITPWEKNVVPLVEKAIMTSELGLNPATAGAVIRLPLPPLTEERRKQMTKTVRQEGENGRVAIRNVRRDLLQHFKDYLKAKTLTEDEERRAGEAAQTLTDKYIQQVDALVALKEKDLLAL